jgi:hypothetical protein
MGANPAPTRSCGSAGDRSIECAAEHAILSWGGSTHRRISAFLWPLGRLFRADWRSDRVLRGSDIVSF